MSGADTCRELDFSNMEGITDLKGADIHLDGFGKVVRQAGDFNRVDILLDEATGFDPGGFAVEVSRDMGGDGGVFVDRAEVGVEGDAG